jgi:formate-dependent nitrite reductase membrane component NrfD
MLFNFMLFLILWMFKLLQKIAMSKFQNQKIRNGNKGKVFKFLFAKFYIFIVFYKQRKSSFDAL